MARKLSPALVVGAPAVHAAARGGRRARPGAGVPARATPRSPGARRRASGCSRPENAVLVAYSKMTLTAHIEDSTLPDEPWFQRVLAGYFPPTIAERFADDLPNHPLHREIITTVVVNDMINRAGTTFVHRAIEETGADIARDRARLQRGARGVRPAVAVGRDRGAGQRGADRRAARRLSGDPPARSTAPPAGSSTSGSRSPTSPPRSSGTQPVVSRARPRAARTCCAAPSGRRCTTTPTSSSRSGLPRELALRLAELLSAFLLLDVVEIAQATGHDAGRGRRTALRGVRAVLRRRTADRRSPQLPRDDRWSTLARSAARHDVYAALSAITTAVLRATDDDARRRRADRRVGARTTPSGSSGRARRSGPRWTARTSIWPPCRWRCGCCAACRQLNRQGGSSGRGRDRGGPGRGPRPACPWSSASHAPVVGRRAATIVQAAPAGRRCPVRRAQDRAASGLGSGHPNDDAVRVDVPADVERGIGAAGVPDGVADELAGDQHDLVDRVRCRRRWRTRSSLSERRDDERALAGSWRTCMRPHTSRALLTRLGPLKTFDVPERSQIDKHRRIADGQSLCPEPGETASGRSVMIVSTPRSRTKLDVVRLVDRPHVDPVAAGMRAGDEVRDRPARRCSPGPAIGTPAAASPRGAAGSSRSISRTVGTSGREQPDPAHRGRREAHDDDPVVHVGGLAQAHRRARAAGPAEPGEQVDQRLLDQPAVAGRVLGLDQQPHRAVGVVDQAEQHLQGQHPAAVRPGRSGATPARYGRVGEQLVGRVGQVAVPGGEVQRRRASPGRSR